MIFSRIELPRAQQPISVACARDEIENGVICLSNGNAFRIKVEVVKLC